jgi:hypothetical protein
MQKNKKINSALLTCDDLASWENLVKIKPKVYQIFIYLYYLSLIYLSLVGW